MPKYRSKYEYVYMYMYVCMYLCVCVCVSHDLFRNNVGGVYYNNIGDEYPTYNNKMNG
jgi:hypothetical protein